MIGAAAESGPSTGPGQPGSCGLHRPGLTADSGPNLCLFDLDHTLLPIDSDHAWNDFVIERGWVDATESKRASEAFFEQYRAGSLDIHEYIEFATRPLRKRSPAELNAAHADFMRSKITPFITDKALALVREHQARGDRVAIVTATNDFITGPIAAAFGVAALIAVRLARDAAGTITGRIEGMPSFREGKVARIGEWLARDGLGWGSFRRVSAYSDSWNDLPMLERATDPVAVDPSAELARVAAERGWTILHLLTIPRLETPA